MFEAKSICALALAIAMSGAACSEAPTSLKRPNALCLAADGTLYVSDFHHQRVVALDAADGSTRSVFGQQGVGTGDLWQVWDLACDGEDLWALNQRITSADDSSQIVEAKHFVGGAESVARRLSLPDAELKWLGSFSHLPDGSWVATDDERHALLFFDSDLRYRDRWRGAKGGEAFKGPSFVRRRGEALWIVEQSANRVRRLSLDGRELGRFGREGRGPGEILYPSSLDVCRDDWVVVADYGNYRIQRFTLDGRYIDGFEPAWRSDDAPAQLMRVELSPDCERLYMADSKGNRVLVTSPTGQVIQEITTVDP